MTGGGRLVAAAAAILLVAAGMGWQLGQLDGAGGDSGVWPAARPVAGLASGPQTGAAPSDPPAAPRVAGGASAARTPAVENGQASAPARAAEAARPLRPEAPPGPPRVGEFDVCGIGRLKGDPDMPAAAAPQPGAAAPGPTIFAPPKAVVELGLAELWASLRLQMLAADPAQRAIGWLMRDGAAGDARGVPEDHWIVDRSLVALAMDSADPAVIQWALRSCRRSGNASCWGLSARHWVRAEPANVAAWAWLAQDEPGNLAEALHGMTRAAYSDLRVDVLALRIEAALPEATPPHLRMSALLRAQQIESDLPLVQFKGLFTHCHAEVQADANRRQQCEAVARVMTGHGRDVLSMMLGRRIAERLEGPGPELARMNEEIRSLQMVLAGVQAGANPAQPFSCASVAATRRWLAGVRDLGEVAWLRRERAGGR